MRPNGAKFVQYDAKVLQKDANIVPNDTILCQFLPQRAQRFTEKIWVCLSQKVIRIQNSDVRMWISSGWPFCWPGGAGHPLSYEVFSFQPSDFSFQRAAWSPGDIIQGRGFYCGRFLVKIKVFFYHEGPIAAEPQPKGETTDYADFRRFVFLYNSLFHNRLASRLLKNVQKKQEVERLQYEEHEDFLSTDFHRFFATEGTKMHRGRRRGVFNVPQVNSGGLCSKHVCALVNRTCSVVLSARRFRLFRKWLKYYFISNLYPISRMV